MRSSVAALRLLALALLQKGVLSGGNGLGVLSGGNGLVTIMTDDPNLSFGQWQYREVMTSPLNPICYGWDFLQGGGFFPMTWFLYPEPLISQEGTTNFYEYTIDRSYWASACFAEPDGINTFMEVAYSTSRGNLVIKPDENAGSSTNIRCGPGPCTTCDVVCEEAVLKWTGREEVTVTVTWQES